MTVADLKRILRNAPAEAEVVLLNHGTIVAFKGYGVDKDSSGVTSHVTLKTESLEKGHA